MDKKKPKWIIKLQRFWIDFKNWQEWTGRNFYFETRHKIMDYDRLASDYITVLDSTTCGRMSRHNYELTQVLAEISDAQSKLHYGIVHDDLMPMIESKDWDAVKKYVEELSDE